MSFSLTDATLLARAEEIKRRGEDAVAARYVMPDAAKVPVETALALGLPLLVTGEPGTGKSTLAYALATQLGTKLFRFQTQSVSSAGDLRYHFDEVRRFREAWEGARPKVDTPAAPKADYSHTAGLPESVAARFRDHPRFRYVEARPLWQAIAHGEATGRPAVLLIDEVDKAPKDFPNDLLQDLDQLRFHVSELGVDVFGAPATAPILIITSNEDRELPGPFLRRCVWLRLKWEDDHLRKVVDAALPALGDPSAAFVEMVIKQFLQVRNRAIRKKPTTGELLVWFRALHHLGFRDPEGFPEQIAALPALEVLLKHKDDLGDIRGKGAAG